MVRTPEINKPLGEFRHGCAEYVVTLKRILNSARGFGLDIFQSKRELLLTFVFLVRSGDHKFALGFQCTLR